MSNKKTVLIVEDEQAMLDALTTKFKKEGFNVLKAGDGEEGLKVALKNKPDLVILDIIMPKMDGMAVAQKIREDKDWGSETEIIMLTNLSDPEQVAEASRFKIYDFLVKTDWRIDDIISIAKKKLGLT